MSTEWCSKAVNECSVDETVTNFRTRHRTLFISAEYAIPGARDEIVQPVQNHRRQHADDARERPRPSQRAQDKECRAAPRERPRLVSSIVQYDVQRRQFLGPSAEARHHRLPGGALQRGKS